MPGRRTHEQRPTASWSRRKMLALLAGAGLTCLVVVAGLVLAVVYAIHPGRSSAIHAQPDPGSSSSGSANPPRQGGVRAGIDPRDALAERPMPSVDAEASHPGPVSTT
ncbi:MAG: hypothetical protein ACRDNS_15890, partial [Trebonia sp.]